MYVKIAILDDFTTLNAVDFYATNFLSAKLFTAANAKAITIATLVYPDLTSSY